MKGIKVLVCLICFCCVISVLYSCRAVTAVWGTVSEAIAPFSRSRYGTIVIVVHFLVRCRHVLWGWCGTAILVGRRVSYGPFRVAVADVRTVQ